MIHFPFIDHFLTWMIKISLLLVFITAILVMINVKKAKYALYLVVLVSIITIIGCLTHPNFQNLIYPSVLSFVTALYLLVDYNMMPSKKSKPA